VSAGADALHAIGRPTDVPYLEGRRVMVAGVAVAVFRTERGFAAIGGVCPHRGGPLSDGIVSERCVTCPLHNWRIDLESGEVVGGDEGSVPAYELIERDGELYLRVSARDGTPLPRDGGALPAAA
jgi:nitrite reductase (NADH) small subunit